MGVSGSEESREVFCERVHLPGLVPGGAGAIDGGGGGKTLPNMAETVCEPSQNLGQILP